VGVPDGAQDVGLRDDLAGVAHQVFQHPELPRGQRDLGVSAVHPVTGRVEPQRADGQHGGPGIPGAPQQGAQPGEEHDERERLDEVVVGAEVEGVGLVVLAVLGGQHEHGCPDRRCAHPLQHAVAR
jgi:hypothetical protein